MPTLPCHPRTACSFTQGLAKNLSRVSPGDSKIFKYFQTFRIIFRIFSNIFKRFTPFFESFQTFSNVSILPVLPSCYTLTPQPPFLPQKPTMHSQIHPQFPRFFCNSRYFYSSIPASSLSRSSIGRPITFVKLPSIFSTNWSPPS